MSPTSSRFSSAARIARAGAPLVPELGRELGPEVFRLEHLANLDLEM